MSDISPPPAPPSGRDVLEECVRQAHAIEALEGQVLDISERLQLYERRLDALAAYFREAAYVL